MTVRRWVIVALLVIALAGFFIVAKAHAQESRDVPQCAVLTPNDDTPEPTAILYWPPVNCNDPNLSWWDWWAWGCYL